jgi:hypothetical protein
MFITDAIFKKYFLCMIESTDSEGVDAEVWLHFSATDGLNKVWLLVVLIVPPLGDSTAKDSFTEERDPREEQAMILFPEKDQFSSEWHQSNTHTQRLIMLEFSILYQ